MITKTVMVSRLLVTRAATVVCCCCRRGSACWYACLCFLVQALSETIEVQSSYRILSKKLSYRSSTLCQLKSCRLMHGCMKKNYICKGLHCWHIEGHSKSSKLAAVW